MPTSSRKPPRHAPPRKVAVNVGQVFEAMRSGLYDIYHLQCRNDVHPASVLTAQLLILDRLVSELETDLESYAEQARTTMEKIYHDLPVENWDAVNTLMDANVFSHEAPGFTFTQAGVGYA